MRRYGQAVTDGSREPRHSLSETPSPKKDAANDAFTRSPLVSMKPIIDHGRPSEYSDSSPPTAAASPAKGPTVTPRRAGPLDRNALLWTAAGTAVGLTLLYASTRKVEPTALLTTIRSAELLPTMGVLLATLSFVAIKAWRWTVLLPFVPAPKLSRVHQAVYVGLAVNFLIAHVGEFLRAATVARGCNAPMSAVLASVMLERALDFVALAVLLILLSTFASELPGFIRVAVLITGGIVVVSLSGLYFLLHAPVWLKRVASALMWPFPDKQREWLLRQFGELRRGLAALRSLRMTLLAICASVLQWVFVLLAIWCSALAVNIEAHIVPVFATFVLIIVGLTLPNSPMQIGTTQLAFTVGLGTQAVAASNAIAASVVYTLLLIVPIMVIGGVCLLRARRLALPSA